MKVVKTVIFAPVFLILLACSLYFLGPVLSHTDFIFTFDVNVLAKLLIFCGSLLLTYLFYSIFVTLSQDWKIILPIIFVSGILPLILLPAPVNYIFTIGLIILLLLESVLLMHKLKTYITFSTATLLTPSIKALTTLTLVISVFSYYLLISADIAENGFEVPEQLIDYAMGLATSSAEKSIPVKGEKYLAQIPQLTSEQLKLLRENPDLLRQYGLDPAILDEYENASAPNLPKPGAVKLPQKPEGGEESPNQLLRELIKNQFNTIIRPYQKIIPIFLAVGLFLILQPIISILSILINPLLWIIFKILQRSKFVKFYTEMREIKKLVV